MQNTLDKRKIARRLYKSGMTLLEAESSLNFLLDLLSNSLIKGEKIVLSGFGTFHLENRRQKMLGMKIVPEHCKIVFKPSRVLKSAVNARRKG